MRNSWQFVGANPNWNATNLSQTHSKPGPSFSTQNWDALLWTDMAMVHIFICLLSPNRFPKVWQRWFDTKYEFDQITFLIPIPSTFWKVVLRRQDSLVCLEHGPILRSPGMEWAFCKPATTGGVQKEATVSILPAMLLLPKAWLSGSPRKSRPNCNLARILSCGPIFKGIIIFSGGNYARVDQKAIFNGRTVEFAGLN